MISALGPAAAAAPLSALDIATFVVLAVSIGALWCGPRAWRVGLVLSVALGYASGVLSGLAALWLALFASACFLYSHYGGAEASESSRVLRSAALLGMVGLGLALALHGASGFHNPRILRGAILSPGAAPYDLSLNFDKTAAGLLVLGLCYHGLLRTRAGLAAALARAVVPGLLTIAALLGIALLVGYVRWAPKFTRQFWVWATVNLLMTCMSEEAFFRGFIQVQVCRVMRSMRGGGIVAVASSAILFGLAHLQGGWTYVALAAAAGMGYAIVFQRTQRIEMSILTHFSLNAVQYLLFTYPYWRH